uniref:Uncharacterized protein n=1 Tax=Rhizophora mucronata TaxID=61149 RepID=A0A2P2QS32_RHIMU
MANGLLKKVGKHQLLRVIRRGTCNLVPV